MAAKPIKTVELHFQMSQFLITRIAWNAGIFWRTLSISV